MNWLSFISGSFIGGILGVFFSILIIGLCQAAAKGDRQLQKERDHMETVFSPKDQIVYIPQHVLEETSGIRQALKHPDIEFGFVFSDVGSRGVFCRYWSKYSPGELRTKANSELTPRENIFLYISRAEDVITQAWNTYIESPED